MYTIYCFVCLSLVSFFNKKYSQAIFLVSIASTQIQPTIFLGGLYYLVFFFYTNPIFLQCSIFKEGDSENFVLNTNQRFKKTLYLNDKTNFNFIMPTSSL